MSHYDADGDIGRNMIRRVEVVEVDDTGEFQIVRALGLAGEMFEFPIRKQGHGISSNPKPGCIGTALLVGGRPDQAVLMGLEHPKERPRDLKPGEVMVYASEGQTDLMDEKGNRHINTSKGIVYIN